MIIPYNDLDASSKVWIYQAEEALSDSYVEAIRSELNLFLEEWTAHNQRLYTFGDILYNRFLVIIVDERYAGASGCSIDASVRFVQHLEKKYNISLLERMQIAYLTEENNVQNIATLPLHDLKTAAKAGQISDQSIVFDNLVKTKGDFDCKWKVRLEDSWHRRFI